MERKNVGAMELAENSVARFCRTATAGALRSLFLTCLFFLLFFVNDGWRVRSFDIPPSPFFFLRVIVSFTSRRITFLWGIHELMTMNDSLLHKLIERFYSRWGMTSEI